jgi:MarR family transcriptional regulator, organic hydroperoxide resistance regulator
MDELLLMDREVLFSILSGRASAAINRRFYKDFRSNDISITPEQWLILLFLSFKDGITQQELAIKTFKGKPSVTRLLDNLEKQSLIARLSDKLDKRSNLIYITKAGWIIHQKTREIALDIMKCALQGITEDEAKMGENLLKKIFKNLE